MAKKAKSEPDTNQDLKSSQMKLRFSGVVAPQSAKETPVPQRPSLIGDKSLDEEKIIQEFQAKRKCLMKILKEKQRQKASGTPVDEIFHVNEGILQFHNSQSQAPDSQSINQEASGNSQEQEPQVNYQINSKSQQQNTQPISIQSEKIDVAVQTEKKITKKHMILRSPKKYTAVFPKTIKKITKQGGKAKIKKGKKTKEQIQRLKNQITSLFISKKPEFELAPENVSRTHYLGQILSKSNDKEYFSQISFKIQKINNEIEAYYYRRNIKDIVLNQYKENYNHRKYTNSLNDPEQSSNQSIKDKFTDLDYFETRNKKIHQNFETQLLRKETLKNIEGYTSKRPKQQNENSNGSRNRKEKRRSSKGLLNQRFQIIAQNFSNPVEKNQTLKSQSLDSNIKNEPGRAKSKTLKDQPEDYSENSQQFVKSREIYFDEQTSTEAQLQHSKAWVREFDIEVELIYEKHPKLRKYQLSRKVLSSESKQMQMKINQIKYYCEEKSKKIAKRYKRPKIKQQKSKPFKEKLQTISKGKANQDVFLSQASQQKEIKANCLKKIKPKLKELVVQDLQDEFGKSFDHRSRKRQKFVQGQSSQAASHDFKESDFYNQIYDVLCDDINKSHQFYFSSGTSNGLNDSMEKKSVKLENKKLELNKNMSRSNVDTSNEFSRQRKRGYRKSIEASFFKSQQGQEYFNMSGDNPLNF